MKGDIILRKRYADIIRRFLFADAESAMWPWAIIFIGFFVAVLVIHIAIIPLMASVDHLMLGDISSKIITTFAYSRTFDIGSASVSVVIPLWRGNVLFALFDVLYALELIFAFYVPASVMCSVAAMYCKFHKDYL
jgi:hypothetical protein